MVTSRLLAAASSVALVVGGSIIAAAAPAAAEPSCHTKIVHPFDNPKLYAYWGICTGTYSGSYSYHETIVCPNYGGPSSYDGPEEQKGSGEYSKVGCTDNDKASSYSYVLTTHHS